MPKHSPKGSKKRSGEGRSSRGNNRLVIVESPAKARTIGRYLGRGYQVRASIGHVRDLLRTRLSVDVENDFQPHYRVPNEKRDVVKELKAAAAEADQVYLATDPDREGEAIAWHLIHAADIDEEKVRRVVFHEITEEAIQRAFAEPRGINNQLVNAQQARRILDRLVGYQISPILWEKIRNRLTAGRVQSVAVRLVVEREREIEAFVPEEYWSIQAELAKQLPPGAPEPEERESFLAKLHRIRGKKFELTSQEQVQEIVDELERSSYVVSAIRRGQRRRNPPAPFITSTMQQEASRRLGFNARRTMRVAQSLYEGVPIGEEGSNVGLITYMRTDSTHVAEAAQQEVRRYVEGKWGPKYLPSKPPRHRTRARKAQEAHEAIRPTSVFRDPRSLKRYLNRDQYRLYDLIWRRFVASQMGPAVYDTLSVDIEAGLTSSERPYLFRATASILRFKGYLAVYASPGENGEDEMSIPDLEEGEALDLLQLLPEQHFTQPPPRYTEATLIRALEERGIGRPSTYAPIMSTIQARGYVEQVDRRLHPTPIAFIVNDRLVEFFPEVMDVNFTARMEDMLDDIASGEREWVPVVRDFYDPFSKRLERARTEMKPAQLEEESTGEVCEKCGHPMVVKYGRYGKFLACSNYPECRNTKSYMERTGVPCPQCEDGELVRRRSRRKRIFYGCSNYPDCDFVVWKQPLKTPCPACGGLLTEGRKGQAQCTQCKETFPLDQVEGSDETES